MSHSNKKPCTFKKQPDGSFDCGCETCRFSARDLADAPTVDPAANRKAIEDDAIGGGPHDPTPEEETIYDDDHAAQVAMTPSAAAARFIQQNLLVLIDQVEGRLGRIEHHHGRKEIRAFVNDAREWIDRLERMKAEVAKDVGQ